MTLNVVKDGIVCRIVALGHDVLIHGGSMGLD